MRFVTCLLLLGILPVRIGRADDAFREVAPLVKKYCVACHEGKDANGGVDLAAVLELDRVDTAWETWESVVDRLESRDMPPEDEPQPSDAERARIIGWYQHLVESIEPRPAVHRPRRLAVHEYRNTLASVLGFDLEVAIIEAEQTLAEQSLVVKLMPTDPPGRSGFKNDTHENPLTTVVWDQYNHLAHAGVEELFLPRRRDALEALAGSLDDGLDQAAAERILKTFAQRTQRRPVPDRELEAIVARIDGKQGEELEAALRVELKALLVSSKFVYRGLLVEGEPGARQLVDGYELAERLSYFLWSDMPDERLLERAAVGELAKPEVLRAEIDRMLADPRARNLAEHLGVEWFSLDEIEHVTNNVPQMLAYKSQPIDFLHYLFTENRPLLELVDADVAFVNPHTRGHYGADAGQMKPYRKQKGIEVEAVPNQPIVLEATTERGGLLTTPGVLAMNKGPIQRGVWILERVLGDELPEPPPDVGQVPASPPGKKLTFRERFELHRSKPSCAVCHDRIDPLGFAMESFGGRGEFLRGAKNDTTGRLPTGERFDDARGLKQILVTTRREDVLRNIVRRTLSYALCRRLELHDRPTVEAIVKDVNESNGTWRDLFVAIATSVPFQETILSEE